MYTVQVRYQPSADDVAVVVPGADDVTVAVLMAGRGEVGPVEGEGGVGEDPLVGGEAEAARGDARPVHS